LTNHYTFSQITFFSHFSALTQPSFTFLVIFMMT